MSEVICDCAGVTREEILSMAQDGFDYQQITKVTRACRGCGSCAPLVVSLIHAQVV